MKILIQKLYFYFLYLVRKKSPKAVFPGKPEKILLVMCKWIGDTFWDMQGIPALKKKFPDVEIHVLIKPFSRFLFNGVLPDSRIHISSQVTSDCRRETFSFSQWKKELAVIRAEKMDLLIDFTETPFSAVFASLSGAKYLIGYDHLGRFSRLYHQCVHAEYGLHLSRRPMQLYFPLLGFEPEFPQICPVVTDPVKPGFDVILFPGVGWQTKEYPAEKYHKIVKRLTDDGFSVCIAGSEKEKALCEKAAGDISCVKIQIGSLEEMLRHLASAKVCLSGDTGPAHLAAAMGIPVISLFCGTNPELCGPSGANVIILRSSCPEIPHNKIHFCPVDRRFPCHRACFMDISEDMILSFLYGVLRKKYE